MQYTILRENHVIEKGMSMKVPRKGFGLSKVSNLIARLGKYAELYGAKDIGFTQYPVDTIQEYINYTLDSGVACADIVLAFHALCEKAKVRPRPSRGGVVVLSRENVIRDATCSFPLLLKSRHSIRYFDQQHLPTRKQIDEILELAQLTPSACNRQAWHTHVFQGAESSALVKWQGGSRGFEDEMTTTILVTADLKGFLWHEVHQAYVDGGLYAMNLINAIHAQGMGGIPLSTGFESQKLQGLKDFGIPENEVPILIVGFGNLLPEFKVAVSTRKQLSCTNTYHGDFS